MGLTTPGLTTIQHETHIRTDPIAVESNTALESAARFFSKLFDTSDFAPRWRCGNWPPELGWLHIIADGAIFFAYAAIPASLMFFLLRRRDVPFRTIYWLFVAFILSCGITHLIDATMFYYPAYRFLGVMKLVTATVSLFTVFALARIMPEALKIPAVLRAHRDAETELAQRRSKDEKLETARSQLEERGAMLTVRDRRLRRAMNAATAGAVGWKIETGEIEWEVGLRELLGDPPVPSPTNDTWAKLIGPENAERVRAESEHASRTGGQAVIELPVTLASGGRGVIRIRAHADPGAAGESPTMSGLVGVIATDATPEPRQSEAPGR